MFLYYVFIEDKKFKDEFKITADCKKSAEFLAKMTWYDRNPGADIRTDYKILITYVEKING